MNSVAQDSSARIPLWLALIAGLLAIGFLAGLFLLDTWLTRQPWSIYVVVVPVYFLLQVCAEGALEALWFTKRWLARVFALASVAGFYLFWFARQ